MQLKKFSELFLINLFFIYFLLQPFQAYSKPISLKPSIFKSSNYASIVVNAKTGRVLFEKNADQKRYPASLTKMMTLYITFESLKKNKLSPLQKLTVSKHASEQPKSNIDLKRGQKITVRQAINALIVKSANDAAVVLGEAISGDRKRFVQLMNITAKKLNMKNTNFQNPHGLHHEEQYTTARDMAKLASALKRDFPKYYHLFSMTSFIYRGKEIKGHNRVLKRYAWADGLKTGYVNASGFNLATSTKKPEADLVAIVMGGQTARMRDDHMIDLLNNAYARLGVKDKVKNENISQPKFLNAKRDVFQYVSESSKKTTNNNDILEIH